MHLAQIHTVLSKTSGNLLYLSIFLSDFSSTITILIDSDASLNFIHENIVSLFQILTESCLSIQISVADGRNLLHSNHQVTLNLTIVGISLNAKLSPIGVHSMILGMPWLEYINSLIDWRLKTVHSRVLTSLPAFNALNSSLRSSSIPRNQIHQIHYNRRQNSRPIRIGDMHEKPDSPRLVGLSNPPIIRL